MRVPFGPRFDLRTSWRPLAADIFTAKACDALATSAFGFSDLIADMFILGLDTRSHVVGRHARLIRQTTKIDRLILFNTRNYDLIILDLSTYSFLWK